MNFSTSDLENYGKVLWSIYERLTQAIHQSEQTKRVEMPLRRLLSKVHEDSIAIVKLSELNLLVQAACLASSTLETAYWFSELAAEHSKYLHVLRKRWEYANDIRKEIQNLEKSLVLLEIEDFCPVGPSAGDPNQEKDKPDTMTLRKNWLERSKSFQKQFKLYRILEKRCKDKNKGAEESRAHQIYRLGSEIRHANPYAMGEYFQDEQKMFLKLLRTTMFFTHMMIVSCPNLTIQDQQRLLVNLLRASPFFLPKSS
jgi:hypothetical protein